MTDHLITLAIIAATLSAASVLLALALLRRRAGAQILESVHWAVAGAGLACLVLWAMAVPYWMIAGAIAWLTGLSMPLSQAWQLCVLVGMAFLIVTWTGTAFHLLMRMLAPTSMLLAPSEGFLRRYGVERYLSEAGVRPFAVDILDGAPRRLYRIGGLRVLEVENGTAEASGQRRHYFLFVSPRARTPAEAVAISYGLSFRGYREAVRT